MSISAACRGARFLRGILGLEGDEGVLEAVAGLEVAMGALQVAYDGDCFTLCLFAFLSFVGLGRFFSCLLVLVGGIGA